MYMSIIAMKNKSIIQYGGASLSKGRGGSWLNQGPFGKSNIAVYGGSGPGFSLNGGTRSGSYIGKTMSMSKNGTPFRGVHAMGNGGTFGQYKQENVFNLSREKSKLLGSQAEFIKPSTLSTKGMLEKKYRWINSGTYPNYWVQPDASLPYNFSQQVYIDKLAAANITVNNTNDPKKFEQFCHPNVSICQKDRIKKGGNLVYSLIDSAARYTKELYIPQTSSQHTLQIQRKCAQPFGLLKPFPFAANGGSHNSSGTSNRYPPAVPQQYYLSPPEWYIATGKCPIK